MWGQQNPASGRLSGGVNLFYLNQFVPDPLPRLHPLALDSARQFLLPPELNHGVLLGDLGVRVSGDLGRLDACGWS